ncbi:MAG TPA: ribonuclease P protein component [Gammaproteobacteria bacterium]|nr:ribonuclease P protein component [Gammaproteobacteria bacterium]
MSDGIVTRASFSKFCFLSGAVNHLSVICSKKIFKKAVDRNRIQRVYKACFTDLITALPTGTYVVVVKRGVTQINWGDQYKEVRNEWLSLIQAF